VNDIAKAAALFGFPPDREPPMRELSKRWRVLRSQLHPDREGGDAEKFNEAKQAYDTLYAFITRTRDCPVCFGVGKVETRHGFDVMRQTCRRCHGTGEIKPQPNGEER
jgi:DnaJ-class molecular chaperone